ncbi:hypothetical protein [Hymenobacter volaticus]|uniref:Uncharacterized protein n=1 Tax=Hymenobacter volaticus TaxID=2932254 RepID=A0ABY4GEL7_9BACT|nr:hypothetical protein [Hymenobacter volaticus]UOQ69251.1 hypothetical protein MUN86_27750 [Hymenobacter volaticus]
MQEIPLPQRAKDLTPFEHIQINWASQGHDMEGPNGPVPIGPHYDPRFFMTSLAERQAIPASTDPDAKFNVLPPPGICLLPIKQVKMTSRVQGSSGRNEMLLWA